jgi:hypothetical protein
MPIQSQPELTTTYEVTAVDSAAKLATVRFENPYYSGAHIVEAERPVLDEAGEPTGQTETHLVDQDPNPHAVKTVRVPLLANGQVDHAAFIARLADQARGVRQRMETAHAAQPADDLEHLVGSSSPSP